LHSHPGDDQIERRLAAEEINGVLLLVHEKCQVDVEYRSLLIAGERAEQINDWHKTQGGF
jgi:hypothetical protein